MNFSAVYTQKQQRPVQTSSIYSLTFMGPYVDLLARDPCTSPNDAVRQKLHRDRVPVERVPRRGLLLLRARRAGAGDEPALLRGVVRPHDLQFGPEGGDELALEPGHRGRISRRCFAVDRNFYNYHYLFPAGVPYNAEDGDTPSQGSTSRSNSRRQAVNAEVTASVSRAFGDLNTRTRGALPAADAGLLLLLWLRIRLRGGGGSAAPETRTPNRANASSSENTTREEGYFLITGLDYLGKYIFDGVVRRDGSSLFGASQRWATYYRTSFAYRPSMESWWPVPDQINEFKLFFSRGTAGRRPGFSAQYETYVVSAGSIRPNVQGNKDIRPQLSTENEFG